jgi:8-oxo-dGTP diphosphatase
MVNTRSSAGLPVMNEPISRARKRGTGTVRDWCDFGLPRTTRPPTSEKARRTSIQAGLCREIREETGLSVKPLRLTGVYKNMSRGIISLVFQCQVLGGELTTNDEVSEFRWATGDEVTSLVDEAFAVRVLDALEESSTPPVRQHDGVHLLV